MTTTSTVPPAHRPAIGSAPARVLFLGRTYVGHGTRFANLKRHTEGDPRIVPIYRQVSGWVDGGSVERLRYLPAGARARARVAMQGVPFAGLPRPDVIWSSAGDAIVPYAWAQCGPLRRPFILDLDWTIAQQEELAPIYFQRPPKRGARKLVARMLERLVWRSVTLFTPWSNWAAESLRRQGVEPQRIYVLPPGVDLDQWQPHTRDRPRPERPLRLLFVGGDFARKGGDLLLDAVRHVERGAIELDIVTRAPVAAPAGVRVHRAEPNSALLRELYARADLFVMPSRAECFGIATIEAMACGLPVLVGDVGGARDIVDVGVTGWLIAPTEQGVMSGIRRALAERERLPGMGAQARQVAEERFDGRRNDARIVELLIAQIAQHRHGTMTAEELPREDATREWTA